MEVGGIGILGVSNGGHPQNRRVLSHFSIATQTQNCIFSMLALIARRSKYDFWIPGEILGLEKKSEQKSFCF